MQTFVRYTYDLRVMHLNTWSKQNNRSKSTNIIYILIITTNTHTHVLLSFIENAQGCDVLWMKIYYLHLILFDPQVFAYQNGSCTLQNRQTMHDNKSGHCDFPQLDLLTDIFLLLYDDLDAIIYRTTHFWTQPCEAFWSNFLICSLSAFWFNPQIQNMFRRHFAN